MTKAQLNANAALLCEQLIENSETLGVEVLDDGMNVPLVDCGIKSFGSLRAGLAVAEICMAGLSEVQLVPLVDMPGAGPGVSVWTDQPVAACMAAQYAGWEVKGDDYFAMGSGPMRAAAGKEELYDRIGFREAPSSAIGVLESRQLPPSAVGEKLAQECEIETRRLTLLVAPTASLVGTTQIVARSIETALHKLDSLGFDLKQVRSGYGIAPLPPIPKDNVVAIGRTNDAILYGGRVTLWVTADDDQLSELIAKVPSDSSSEHGRPFAEVFAEKKGDFYAIDPQLFSPAWIRINNLSSGRAFEAGRVDLKILCQSFTD